MARRLSAPAVAAPGSDDRQERADRPPVSARRRRRRTPDRLKNHCARWTGPRDEVFNVLVGTQEHLSAMDIFARLRPSSPEIGLTTVYRTIELLETAGLVRKVPGHGAEARFEYRRGDREDHHHHLICTACGRIVNYRDFETEELSLVQRTEERLARKHGFLIRDHNIEFLGLCRDCRPGGPRSLLQTADRSRSGSLPAAGGSPSPGKVDS
jgi:Fur family transcriptional regulator, ferric uptake regulator